MNKYKIGDVLFYFENGELGWFEVEIIEIVDGKIMYAPRMNDEFRLESDCHLSKRELIQQQVNYWLGELAKLPVEC